MRPRRSPAPAAAADEREQAVEVARHVDEPDRLGVEPELGPGDRLASSSSVPNPPGSAMKASESSCMSALRSCNVSTTWSSRQPAMGDLALLEARAG